MSWYIATLGIRYKARDRTGAQLLRDFMRSYVAQHEQAEQYDAWLAKKVEQSRVQV